MSIKHRVAGALALSLCAFSVFGASAADAADTPIFSESFESCTEPTGDPAYVGIQTAIHSADPIHVDLWPSELVDCPGWTAAGQAWMVEYSSGASFPDGTHAVWLNESPSGSITREITGLTAGHDYRVSVETWTDDQDASTSLALNVTNGSDVANLSIDLVAGEGIQSLYEDFSAFGDTVTIELVGSASTTASPLIDNIRITDAGITGGSPSPSRDKPTQTKAALAFTGVNPTGFVAFAGILLIGGFGLILLRRRGRQR